MKLIRGTSGDIFTQYIEATQDKVPVKHAGAVPVGEWEITNKDEMTGLEVNSWGLMFTVCVEVAEEWYDLIICVFIDDRIEVEWNKS